MYETPSPSASIETAARCSLGVGAIVVLSSSLFTWDAIFMIDFLENILFYLKEVPGLGFLGAYYSQIVVKRGRITQKVSDLEAARDRAIIGAKTLRDAPKNVKGSKKR